MCVCFMRKNKSNAESVDTDSDTELMNEDTDDTASEKVWSKTVFWMRPLNKAYDFGFVEKRLFGLM